ncbi:MAG TPA: ABC transporter permease [Mycobacteriales bacterium]|nr:ABC transporter permease [Mycobacteriales bacterium]
MTQTYENAPRTAAARVSAGTSLAAFLLDGSHFVGRQVRALLRQPAFLVITLVQPVIWLLLFGQLFKRVSEIPGFATGSYVAFLTPGIVVMTALFSSGWAGMGFIIDMERGVLNRFLVTPAPRGSLIAGNLGYLALTSVIQSLIIIGLGLATGARFPGGPGSLAALIGCAVLLAAAFGSFSNALALLLRSQESVISVAQLLVLPLSFLSSSLMPENLLPGWIHGVARFNPVNWAVVAGRETLHQDVDWGIVASRASWLLLLALACGWLSTRAFRAYQRSV